MTVAYIRVHLEVVVPFVSPSDPPEQRKSLTMFLFNQPNRSMIWHLLLFALLRISHFSPYLENGEDRRLDAHSLL